MKTKVISIGKFLIILLLISSCENKINNNPVSLQSSTKEIENQNTTHKNNITNNPVTLQSSTKEIESQNTTRYSDNYSNYRIEEVPLLIKTKKIIFSEGIGLFEFNGKYGYLDENGEVIIDAIYGQADAFKDNIALVAKEKLRDTWGIGWMLIDAKGNILKLFSDDFIDLHRHHSNLIGDYIHSGSAETNNYFNKNYYLNGEELPEDYVYDILENTSEHVYKKINDNIALEIFTLPNLKLTYIVVYRNDAMIAEPIKTSETTSEDFFK